MLTIVILNAVATAAAMATSTTAILIIAPHTIATSRSRLEGFVFCNGFPHETLHELFDLLCVICQWLGNSCKGAQPHLPWRLILFMVATLLIFASMFARHAQNIVH